MYILMQLLHILYQALYPFLHLQLICSEKPLAVFSTMIPIILCSWVGTGGQGGGVSAPQVEDGGLAPPHLICSASSADCILTSRQVN